MMNVRILTILAVASASAYAPAVVFYNNFDGTDSYSTTGWTITGGSSPPYAQQGFGFTSAATGSLGSITVALFLVTGTNSFTVNLWADSAGLPGSSLGSWTVTNLPSNGSGAPPITINTPSGPTLVSGTHYWLTAQAPLESGSWATWEQTNTNASSTRAFKLNPGDPWSNGGTGIEGGMRLQTAVPEPMSLAVLGLGALALIRRRRANK